MTRLIPAAILAFALAGCIPVPTDVNIGDPLRVDNEPPAVQVVETITLTGCHDPGGYSFTYIGPIDGAPYQQCGLPPLLQKGAK